jgi:hypothetical protein
MSTVEDRDLSIMVGRNVSARRHGQHGEGLADIGGAPPYTGDAEPGLATPREEPLVLALFLGLLRIGKLVEAVGNDQAATRRELAVLRAKVVNRPAILARPAPPTLNKLTRFTIAIDRSDDRRGVSDFNVIAWLDVGRALREADLDFDVGEVVGDRPGTNVKAIVVAHFRLQPVARNQCSYYVLNHEGDHLRHGRPARRTPHHRKVRRRRRGDG